MSRLLNLRGYLILAAVVVALILTMSWCSDRARLKDARREASIAAATGKAVILSSLALYSGLLWLNLYRQVRAHGA